MAVLGAVLLALAAGLFAPAPLQPEADDSWFYAVDMDNFMPVNATSTPFNLPSSTPSNPASSIGQAGDASAIPGFAKNVTAPGVEASTDLNMDGPIDWKLTFVIPTYSKDLCKFRLAVQKYIKFGNGNIEEIVVMWIDVKDVDPRVQDAQNRLRAAGIRTSLFRMNQVIEHPSAGWLAQQVAKLRVAKFIEAKTYVVVDSKNILVKPLQMDMFRNSRKTFNYDGTPLDSMSQPHKKWYQKTHETLKAQWNGVESVRASVTPFIFHTETVRRMIRDIESETGKSLEQNIAEGSGTEFCFYNVYIRRENLLNELHDKHSDAGLSRVVWHGMDPSKVLSEQESHPAMFFGVHGHWLEDTPAMNRGDIMHRFMQLVGVDSETDWIDDSNVATCFP